MYRTIEIPGADGGPVPVPMLANAATTYWYKQIFRHDPFRDMAAMWQAAGAAVHAAGSAEDDGTQVDPAALDHLSLIGQLAFVMARQAEGADMARTSHDDFLAWLDGFSGTAFAEAGMAVLGLYVQTEMGGSERKNLGARLRAR